MKNALLNSSRTIEDYFIPPDVHDVQRESKGGILTLLVCFVAFLFEAALTWAVLNETISLSFGMIIHLLIVVLFYLYARITLDSQEGRFGILILVAVATTGPFGAAGIALAVLTFLWGTRNAHPFKEWFASIFPRRTQTTSERIYDDIQVGRDESAQEYSVISFLDVMSFGTSAQKRQALAKMTANFHPNFAPIFRKALSDRDNMIRVQAATGISKIETLFLARLMKLSEIKARHPIDPLVTMALAEHYDNYAFTGLLDFDRELANRQKALEHYYEYLQILPADITARTRIGRILMRNKEFDKAYDWFRQCISQGLTSETISQWYSEALFATGRYDELRRYRASLPGKTAAQTETNYNPALKEALALWTESKI